MSSNHEYAPDELTERDGADPTQTGGGDARERPSELRLVGIQNGAYSYSTADDTIPFLLSVIEYDRKRPRSSHREGAETISDDMNAAHWHGYQEGAEAMREADALLILDSELRGDKLADKLAAAIRANPIPGKTDAG